MIPEKHAVIISRTLIPGSAVRVDVDVSDTDLKVSAPLVDFIAALAAEIGNPTLLFSSSALAAKLEAAADAVCQRMKHETRRVM